MTLETAPYCGVAPVPAMLLQSWNTDWRLLTALTLMLLLTPLVTRRGVYLAAWLCLVIAFVSPLCALTVALFSARTVHHLLLVCAVAPLLSAALSRRLYRLPIVATGTAFAAILTIWHMPYFYGFAWDHHGIYWVMQISLLLTAIGFWSSVFGQMRSGQDFGALMMLGGISMVMGMIGAVLTFGPYVLYPQHLPFTQYYGLTPLADQQLAGLLMWVPGFVPFAIAAGHVMRRLFTQDEWGVRA